MSYNYSNRSLERLRTCDERIQNIFEELIKYHDITIIQGHRTEEQHNDYLARGATKVPYSKTKHRHKPSLAIDAAPWPIPKNWGDRDWKERVKFYELGRLVLVEAKRQNVKIRWGGDWDGDGNYNDQSFDDLVHFEIEED